MTIATYQNKKNNGQVNVLEVTDEGISQIVSFINKYGNVVKQGINSFKKEYFYVRGARL